MSLPPRQLVVEWAHAFFFLILEFMRSRFFQLSPESFDSVCLPRFTRLVFRYVFKLVLMSGDLDSDYNTPIRRVRCRRWCIVLTLVLCVQRDHIDSFLRSRQGRVRWLVFGFPGSYVRRYFWFFDAFRSRWGFFFLRTFIFLFILLLLTECCSTFLG